LSALPELRGNHYHQLPSPRRNHCISTGLDHAAIRAGTFSAELLVSVFETAAEFGLNVVGAELAALREALSSMDAPCIASGSDELGRNVGLAVIYPALWRGR
jgi:hypothetical protein